MPPKRYLISGSRGIPRIRSAIWLRVTSEVPPAIAMPREEAAAAAPAIAPAVEAEGGVKQIALLLAGPFIGLAYILLLPFVGLGYLAGMAVRGLARLPMVKTPLTFLKNVGLFVAAPFIGLAYVVLFPFVGAAMLAWTGMKALMAKGPAK